MRPAAGARTTSRSSDSLGRFIALPATAPTTLNAANTVVACSTGGDICRAFPRCPGIEEAVAYPLAAFYVRATAAESRCVNRVPRDALAQSLTCSFHLRCPPARTARAHLLPGSHAAGSTRVNSGGVLFDIGAHRGEGRTGDVRADARCKKPKERLLAASVFRTNQARRVSGAWRVAAWLLARAIASGTALRRERVSLPRGPINRSVATYVTELAYLQEILCEPRSISEVRKRTRRRCPVQRRPVTEKNVEHPCRRDRTHARPLRLRASLADPLHDLLHPPPRTSPDLPDSSVPLRPAPSSSFSSLLRRHLER